MLTNEEKRIEIYSKNEIPTNAAEVTSATSLEDLNLNWAEKDLPEKERTKHVHRLHPYLGKFIPQLVEIFLRKYFKAGQTVLDPFCGSGTTLVQANELGINSIGVDISAFNVLLSKAKTAKYDINILQKEILDILEKVKNATEVNGNQLPLFDNEPISRKMVDTHNEYINAWYAPQALKELLAYRWFVENGGYTYSDLLKVILSRSARSARLTKHYDLDFPKKPQREPYWCYKHSRMCKPVTEAYKFLRRYSFDTLKRIEEFMDLRTDAYVKIYHGDSREIKFPKIEGVITSPPYVGLIDYHDQHTYAYNLLGLEDRRASEIGPAANGTSLKAKEQYQNDIADVFRRIAVSIPRGGRMIIVANDKANLYDRIAKLSGVETENVVYRHVNRRTGRRSNEFYESVFIWRKP